MKKLIIIIAMMFLLNGCMLGWKLINAEVDQPEIEQIILSVEG